MQASTTAETIHFFHSVFSWWDYLLSNDLLDSIYRILSGTNMWSKLHCQRKKISLTVSTPVQLDDCWEEYLRESWSVRAVSELSVWDCRVIIKEVAQCHSHPQAVFFFFTQGQTTPVGQCFDISGWVEVCNHGPPPNSLWASQRPSIPLHRIPIATALTRLPINPLASSSFPISLPALQPVSSCPTTPGLTIAYPAAFKAVNPAPVKLLSA